jgi:hypothetical protein
MKLENKISRVCKQAAVLRYVRDEHGRLVPLPTGQRLHRGKVLQLTLDQN